MKKVGIVETLCNICLSKLVADIVEENNEIYYVKSCSKTDECKNFANDKTLISVNANKYYEAYNRNENFAYGMGIIEIIQSCNIKCATCIANSEPEKEGILTFEEVKSRVKKVLQKKKPNIIVISGGEPTIHPDFYKIMEYIASYHFEHVVLISNGIELANNIEMVQFLSNLKQKIEIYLQFDSLMPNVLEHLRGENLVDIRLNSLKNLEKFNVYTTLVCIVKKGYNDNELANIIETALSYDCVKGITFQPIRNTGRHSSFIREHSISLSEVCNIIETTSKSFQKGSFKCHHMNPLHIEHAYINKNEPLNNSSQKIINYLEKHNKFLFHSKHNIEDILYSNVFRVLVVEYMDRYNFNFDNIENSAIGMIDDKGNIIPLELYYMNKN
jgi:7,8-dihydro-6-hydroxymethylpterin dimethyltransferase